MARVFIDGGSNADILFFSAFDNLWLNDAMIKPSSIPFVGFKGNSMRPEGSVILKVKAAGKSLNVEF